jgi:hypothetical protein
MIEEGVPDTRPVPLTQGIVYAVYGKKAVAGQEPE